MSVVRANDREFRFGPFEFSCGAGELRKGGTKIRLNGQAVQVLTALLENAGQVTTREELRSKLWPEGTFVDFDHSLNAVVNRLRQRLGDSADSPCYIETIPSRGYRFIAPVSATQPPQATAGTEPPAAPRPRYRQFWTAAALALVVGISAPLVWYGWAAIGRLRQREPVTPLKSIAVLPFDNVSGDSSQEYLADGFTEQLITDVSKYRSLRVIARASVMQYKGRRKPPAEIARELNVQTFVDGSVQRAGDRVRVTAQLIDAASNAHLWSETYDRDLRGILDMEEEIAAMVAQQVRASLLPGESPSRHSRALDLGAYQLYLQARHELNEGSEGSLRASIGHFREAVDRDPEYARAWAGMARACFQLVCWPHYEAAAKWSSHARDAAVKAIDLDPSLSEAHVVLAWVNMFFYWDWDKAAQETHRAIELDPNSAEAYSASAQYSVALGRFEDAWRAISRALELSPLDLYLTGATQFILLDARKYSEAIDLGRKALEREPRAAGIRANLGLSLVLSGQGEQGISALRKAVETENAPTFQLALATGLALAGRKEESRAIVRQMEATSKRKYVCTYEIGQVYAALGQTEDVFLWLGKGLSERCSCMSWLKIEPWFDSIRSDSRYVDLLRKIGITTAQPPVFTR
jgi:TolB-like protein/DNA-binding winged helix-turn-helix (wHTH) protein